VLEGVRSVRETSFSRASTVCYGWIVPSGIVAPIKFASLKFASLKFALLKTVVVGLKTMASKYAKLKTKIKRGRPRLSDADVEKSRRITKIRQEAHRNLFS